MITAAHRLPQHQQGILGHRQISQLPPLKQHAPQIISSPPDSQNVYAKPIHSIIKSHPPQRAKAWQPIPCPVEPPAASNTSTNHVPMRNKGGFLPAQTLLIGERTKKRQSHQQHLWEQQRIYTSTVEGAGNLQIERIRLVSRPTQRDIFWDETKGQNLDFRELLQPSPPLRPKPDSGMEEITKSEIGLKGNFSKDLNESVTKSPERITQQNLPWLEDFQKNEQKHLHSWDVLEGQWGCKLWLDVPWERREKEEREMGRNTSGQVNSVHQKWSGWDKET
ncbi:hypothetical protein KOW79_008233 [Hemibagrus wyckioides]|uniref:Uncharacterized protein n=1 Tax=Hemibagrus wyckioides TaxID=337641 RepID=A0A9D3NU33_9TELE|nr:hypothetical protein KOW79_008233 [Hemibagrus wyckioides]